MREYAELGQILGIPNTQFFEIPVLDLVGVRNLLIAIDLEDVHR